MRPIDGGWRDQPAERLIPRRVAQTTPRCSSDVPGRSCPGAVPDPKKETYHDNRNSGRPVPAHSQGCALCRAQDPQGAAKDGAQGHGSEAEDGAAVAPGRNRGSCRPSGGGVRDPWQTRPRCQMRRDGRSDRGGRRADGRDQ